MGLPDVNKRVRDLLLKFHRPGGRYSFYPGAKNWNNSFSELQWKVHFLENYNADKGLDLYIHIPFCESLCTFCGCNIKVTRNHEIESSYISALLQEFQSYTQFLGRPEISSLYLGGGTPTFLSSQSLNRLFEGIFRDSNIHSDFEGTIEGDPRHCSEDQLKVFRDFSLKNMSFGVQDLNQKVGKNVNRVQDLNSLYSVMERSRKFGIENISLDFIYGLPFQTEETITETFLKALDFGVEGISLYPLAHVPWQIAPQKAMGQYDIPSLNKKYNFLLLAHFILTNGPYFHLGGGKYTLKDKYLGEAYRSSSLKRNIMGVFKKKAPQILGLGVGSISHSGKGLSQNNRVFEKYLYQGGKGQRQERSHFQSPQEIQIENAIHGLFENHQLDLSLLKQWFSETQYFELQSLLTRLKNEEMVKGQGDHWSFLPWGLHFLPFIASGLDSNQMASVGGPNLSPSL